MAASIIVTDENFTGEHLMNLNDALFISASRTAHLFDGGKPVVRVQSFPYRAALWYVMHSVVIEEGVPCGIVNDAFGTKQDVLNWLVAHDYCGSVEEARAIVECAVWEPEYAQFPVARPVVQHQSRKPYQCCLVAARS